MRLARVRRRLYKADRDIMLWGGVAQALLCAWAVLLSVTAGSQPIITSACVGAGANILKQFRIFPPAGGGPDGPGDEKRQGALRTCSLCSCSWGSSPACPPALAGGGQNGLCSSKVDPACGAAHACTSPFACDMGGTASGCHPPSAPVTVLVAGGGRHKKHHAGGAAGHRRDLPGLRALLHAAGPDRIAAESHHALLVLRERGAHVACACACPGKSHTDARDTCSTSLHLQYVSMRLHACCGMLSGLHLVRHPPLLVGRALKRMRVAVQTTLLTVGTALTNWVMSSFFR